MRTEQQTDLNALCAERGWSRARLVRELRNVAAARGVQLPGDASLSRMIRMWASGERRLSPFYADLFSALFGVTLVPASTPSTPATTSRQQRDPANAIAASAAQSADLLTEFAGTISSLAIEQLAAELEHLVVEYMSSPPALMASEAKNLRDRILAALNRARRPSHIADLYVIAGQASGILSYAALDLGNARAAMTNARVALTFADLAGSNDLIVWVRGTQSLIARFVGQYRKAEDYLHAGMSVQTRGIGRARLAAGFAQCRAHLGDSKGVRAALDLTKNLHGKAEPVADEVGLFGFPRSKVHYYAASALVALPDGVGANVAVSEALTAIDLFRSGPAEDRFLTDEILAQIHAANGLIQQGELQHACVFLDAVLRTAENQRVSWHRQRLDTINTVLSAPRFRGSRTAADLRQRLSTFQQTSRRRS